MNPEKENKKYNEFDASVEAILRVIRNPDVEMPLTMVINGDWGSGKSSLMNVIQGKLDNESKEGRFVTIWFNAWHLQSEQSLIDEFMLSLVKREPGKKYPFLFKPQIFINRLMNLAFLKQVLFWFYLGLLIPLFLMLILRSSPMHPWLHEHRLIFPDIILSYWLAWKGIICSAIKGSSLPKGTATVVGLALSVLSAVGYYMQHIVPSGVLWWGEMVPVGGFNDKKKEKPLGYRTKFKEQFWDLMEAADDTLRFVVFIDDLDRISGAKILEMLEAINFIMDTASMPKGKEKTSAKMVFVIGMATTEVAKNLGAELNRLAADGLDNRNRGLKYIEKLMNVVIQVPQIDGKDLFLHEEDKQNTMK